jgi:phospholipase/carboxylesterase
VGGVRRLDTGLVIAERAPARAAGGPMATLVLLHGFGRYHGHLLDLWPELGIDCSVVAVQAGFRMGPAAYRWFAYEDLPNGSVAIAGDEERRSKEALISFLDTRRRDEPDRPLFLFGHSQGGMMALSVALLRPGLIGGCAVLNARVLPETVAKLPDRPDLDGMPVFVGHGTADAVVRPDRGRIARDVLSSMGARLTYHEYRAGHEVTLEMVADVADWLQLTLARMPTARTASARTELAERWRSGTVS